jgi:cobalt-precorrin-5B (C1)-methyltransferase
MIGKLSKTAAGKMQTHVAGNQVDCDFLGRRARDWGAPKELAEAIRNANTARHVHELVEAAGFTSFYPSLCELAAASCAAVVPGQLAVEVVLFDFEGRVLGRAVERNAAPGTETARETL